MGTRHIDGLKALAGTGISTIDLVALCDLRPDFAALAASVAQEQFGRKPREYTDTREMIRAMPDLDAVLIVTDPMLYLCVAVDALEEGAHVLVEKPPRRAMDEKLRSMDQDMIELKRITPESFAPYGQVLVWSADNGGRLQIATEEKGGAPWMLATFRVDAHEVMYLAEHPDTIELFSPITGIAVLLLALPETPEAYDAFLLDVPIVINRRVWHGMCSLSEHTIVGIAENSDAGGSRRYLDAPLRVGLA